MSDQFGILARFLDQFDLEVEGRAREDPPEEVKSRLRQFAAGNLGPAEREELTRLLHQHPQWVGFLAEEVKALRPPQAPE
jgi:hypothetical protein